MTEQQRIVQLVKDAAAKAGSQRKLARLLKTTPGAVNHWTSGRALPEATNLLKMQDIVKRAACVLIALAGFTQAPESGATGELSPRSHSVVAQDSGESESPTERLYSLRIVHHWCTTAWRTLEAFLSRATRTQAAPA
jgi:transcriptional regulator with XRE-family HTH domain